MDDGPSDHDNTLLARLNALKQSNVTFKPTNFLTAPAGSTDPVNDLATRFQKLNRNSGDVFNITGTNDLNPAKTTDILPSPTIEELLAELGSEDQYDLNAGERDEAQRLLAEAKRALPVEDQGQHTAKRGKRPSHLPETPSEEHDGSKDDEDKEDDAEADGFLQQILDEVELEKRHEEEEDDHSSSPANAKEALPQAAGSGAANDTLAFPSLPTHDLVPPPPSVSSSPPKSFFPTAPTAAPTIKKVKSTQKRPQTFSDAEIDSWCIICCDDAKVRCQGCAGDLYCWGCWKEGHTGPDAGFEEKRHRWVGLGKSNRHEEGI